MRFTEPTGRDSLNVLLFIVAYAAAVVGGAFLFLPGLWYLWALTIIVGLYLLLLWQTAAFGYRCSNCGNEFTIGMAANFTAVNAFSRRYVRCPACGKRSWADVLKKTGEQE